MENTFIIILIAAAWFGLVFFCGYRNYKNKSKPKDLLADSGCHYDQGSSQYWIWRDFSNS